MKRVVSFLCVLFFFWLSPISCMADTVATFNEYGFSISLPDELYVFTQDMDTSSPVWDETSVDPEAMLEYLKNANITLDAVPLDGLFEIVVVTKDDPKYDVLFNLHSLTDEQIQKEFSSMDSVAGNLGLTVEHQSVYTHVPLKYYHFDGKYDTDSISVYIDSYLTIVNGKSVQITLRSYDGPISDAKSKMLENVVDSVQFNSILSEPTPPIDTARKNADSILHKAIVAMTIALVISVPYYLIQMAKKKSKGTAKEESQKEQLATNAPENKCDTRPEEAVTSNNCENTASTEGKYCSYCGKRIPSDALYCMSCGKKQVEPSIK